MPSPSVDRKELTVQAIPAKAPFSGSYVSWKNEKEKYVRMWLETRGGQVCIAKNEKVCLLFLRSTPADQIDQGRAVYQSIAI